MIYSTSLRCLPQAKLKYFGPLVVGKDKDNDKEQGQRQRLGQRQGEGKGLRAEAKAIVAMLCHRRQMLCHRGQLEGSTRNMQGQGQVQGQVIYVVIFFCDGT